MEEVEGSDDRLKMAVLYFLGSVINPKKKKSAKIDSFLVNIVNDLELCKSFPWGTFTFIHCIDNIRQWIKMFKSKPKSSWTIPGFTIAIEILAFECIQPLKSEFRENVNGDNGCPRMCRSKFKHTGETGYSLDAIYRAIGSTKEILSFLVPNPEEQHLLANIFIDEEDTDSMADSWNDLLTQQNKVLFWNDLYEEDQTNREMVESTKTTKRTNNPRGKGPNVPNKKRKGSDKELRDLRLELGDIKKRLVAVEALGPNGARATDAENNDDMNQEEHREHEEEDAPHMTQEATPNDPSEHEEEDVDNDDMNQEEESQWSPLQPQHRDESQWSPLQPQHRDESQWSSFMSQEEEERERTGTGTGSQYQNEEEEEERERTGLDENEGEQTGTGTEEEEEQEQTGSKDGELRVYVRRKKQSKGIVDDVPVALRTRKPGQSLYGRQYKLCDRFTPAAYK